MSVVHYTTMPHFHRHLNPVDSETMREDGPPTEEWSPMKAWQFTSTHEPLTRADIPAPSPGQGRSCWTSGLRACATPTSVP